jgi:hypothetical protein
MSPSREESYAVAIIVPQNNGRGYNITTFDEVVKNWKSSWKILFLNFKGTGFAEAHYYFHRVSLFTVTYLLTPWSRVLLEKLTGLQLVKKFPAFCGTRRFITALTSARHLSLPCLLLDRLNTYNRVLED